MNIIEISLLLVKNKVFLAMLFSYLASSVIKTLIVLITEKNQGLSSLYRSGGMPSSHTASVVGLTFGILLFEGVGTIFILSLAFAIVVIHDALGVRFETERHARFLNELIKRQNFDKTYFSEHVGHKLPEVIVGVLIGLIVPMIISNLPI